MKSILREFIGEILREDRTRRGSYKVLYHFGKQFPQPQPKATGRYSDGEGWTRPWIKNPPNEAVFMTDDWVDLALKWFVPFEIGPAGSLTRSDIVEGLKDFELYAFRVPVRVIRQSGGIHRYHNVNVGPLKGTGEKDLSTGWREVVIPGELWDQAEFIGKVGKSKVIKGILDKIKTSKRQLVSKGGEKFRREKEADALRRSKVAAEKERISQMSPDEIAQTKRDEWLASQASKAYEEWGLGEAVRELVREVILSEYVVPMGFSLKSWKKHKKKHKVSNADYHKENPDKKWKVVHGHKKGKIGEPLPGLSNVSYDKANKAHTAIVMN